MGGTRENWGGGGRYLVAALCSTADTSDRDLEANRVLSQNPDALVPSQLPKSRTRRYLEHIYREHRVRISVGLPTPTNTFGNGFPIPGPCFPSVILSTVVLYLGNSKRWNDLRGETSKHTDRFPAMTYRATAGIALMMNKTCVGVVGGRTLPFIPFTCALAAKVGMRVTAPSHLADPDTWRISITGRPFAHPNFVFDNIRTYKAPLRPSRLNSIYSASGYAESITSRGATVEEACELTTNMYFECPRKFDIRAFRDTPWRNQIIDNIKY